MQDLKVKSEKTVFVDVTRDYSFVNSHLNFSPMQSIKCEKFNATKLCYLLYLDGPSGIVSPFHDIPLYVNTEKTIMNMVVEVPRWTNAKMEVSRLFVCPCVCPCACPSVRVPVYVSFCAPVHVSVCLSPCLSVCLCSYQ